MLKTPQNIIVIGGSGGIGRSLIDKLLEHFPLASIHATFNRGRTSLEHSQLQWQQLDLRDPAKIPAWASTFDRADWLINCAGYLHGKSGGPEKNIHSINSEFLLENIGINTLPTLLLARYFANALKRSPAPILATISARVGSITDNRLGGWYSYRISKAALNMALKTLSIEWKQSHPRGCVVALHPGTNDTALSKPFQARVALKDLRDPADTASSLIDLLSRLDPGQSGNFFAWNGEKIAW
jgi:NAD(P)-dependent dehydrogenase (short-subunit alcohol dehydrogenase family)